MASLGEQLKRDHPSRSASEEFSSQVRPELTAQEVTQLFYDLKSASTEVGRDACKAALTQHYLPLVRMHATHIAARLPDSVDINDLVQDGFFGLNRCLENFDPSLGIKFETYSARGIKGAMLDGLREQDWLPRLARTRFKALDAAESTLESELGRRPTIEELASAMDTDVESLIELRESIGNTEPVKSLDAPCQDSGDSSRVRSLADTVSGSGWYHEQDSESKEVLEAMLRSVGENDRRIIGMYLEEGKTLLEIGEEVDLSESRISQIFSNALERIADRFRDAANEEGSSIFHVLLEKFGKKHLRPASEVLKALKEEDVKFLDGVNESSPVRFTLTGGEEGFYVPEEESNDEAPQRPAGSSPAPESHNPLDFGFTFYDDEQ